jgi:hypothetical protein
VTRPTSRSTTTTYKSDAHPIDTHCRHQSFYVDADGLIGRHDFVA